jgi:hypothetical protein
MNPGVPDQLRQHSQCHLQRQTNKQTNKTLKNAETENLSRSVISQLFLSGVGQEDGATKSGSHQIISGDSGGKERTEAHAPKP